MIFGRVPSSRHGVLLPIGAVGLSYQEDQSQGVRLNRLLGLEAVNCQSAPSFCRGGMLSVIKHESQARQCWALIASKGRLPLCESH
jgi:hypothetical protein